MENAMLKVSEQFYSVQGEGPTTGRPAYFIRLTGCNLLCGAGKGATWKCDTLEVWRKGDRVTIDSLAQSISELPKLASVIITGGEPLLQQDAIPALLQKLPGRHIEVETNGTVIPMPLLAMRVNQWNVSPKLANSGMATEKRINPEALRHLNILDTVYKFVVSSEDDMVGISEYLQYIPASKVWLMPAGETREELERTALITVELCKKYGFNYTHRTHIAIWNKKTGV